MLTLLKVHPGKVFFFLLFLFHFGFLTAMVFGYLCGTIIDRLLASWRRKKVENLLFLALGKLARADGRIREEEIERTEEIFRQLGVTGKRRQQAIDHFRMGSEPDFDVYEEMEKFEKKGVPMSQKLALLEMLVIFSVEATAGYFQVSQHYLPILKRIARALGINDVTLKNIISLLVAQANFEHFRDEPNPQYGSSQQNGGFAPSFSDGITLAYQALGANKSESDEQIKRKYRKLLSKYHPDKIAGQGLGEDAVKLANEKTRQIQAAYEQIRLARGMR